MNNTWQYTWTDGPKFYITQNHLFRKNIEIKTFIGNEEQILSFLNKLECSKFTITELFFTVQEHIFEKIKENQPKYTNITLLEL